MKSCIAIAVSLFCATFAYSADKAPYTEGPVVEINYVRTKPGMFDAYIKWVNGERKALFDAYKKAGIILNWKVYEAFPRTPHDPDVILTITFKNMAALDDLDARMAPIDEKMSMTRQKDSQGDIDREKLRTVIGGEIIRELLPPQSD